MIVTTRIAPDLSAMLIAVLAVTVVAIAASANSQEPGARPTFEAATIKLAATGAPRNRVMPSSPNRLNIPSMSLIWLVYTAYGDGGFNTAMRVTGPDWTNRTAFAVEAVASRNVTARERRLMLQTLLEDRFALKIRSETSTNEMNTLVLDRADGALGPNVKEWNGTCKTGTPSAEDDPAVPRCLSGYRPGGITIDGGTMFSVAEILSLPQSRQLLGDLVADQTGLTKRYTMELDYVFVPPPPAGSVGADVPGPSLATAIREQWGFRLVRGLAPFRRVVIESAQQPTAN